LFLALWTASAAASPADTKPIANADGKVQTYSTAGTVKRSNAFFKDLGSNGRSCASCHQPGDGWSVTPASIQKRFKKTAGTDPIFRTNDGSNSPEAAVGSLDERAIAYRLLLKAGVFRVGLTIPAGAEFELLEADDPYGFVSAGTATPELSLFRRPLPAANLKFASAVMWDGRESEAGGTIAEHLARQATAATTGHAQGNSLAEDQRHAIVDFETGLFTTQVFDRSAKSLTTSKVPGSPRKLAKRAFVIGENAPYQEGTANPGFDPRVFQLFDAWIGRGDPSGKDPKAAIARGQEIFNTRTFTIKGVAGLNDDPRFGSPPTLTATCSTCHNTREVGSSSLPLYFNTGVSDGARRTRDVPLYTLRKKATGETLTTTDPGRAMITGFWKDVGRFKVPTLRGLAARPPYFHNGQATTLGDVVGFYNGRFGLDLNNREWRDLIAFLAAL
jgi:cytochrome c peroxidase